MKAIKRKLNRRQFLGASATVLGALAFPDIIPVSVLGANAPSNRITVACIGVGGEGTKNLNAFLAQPDARVVAVCEVDRGRGEVARNRVNEVYNNKDCPVIGDFREVLARRDIDAVMISTPDHWHVPLSLLAIRAGKDVICEKPTLTIEEGRVLSDTVKRYGAIFQTSTEDRSLAQYHRMAELVRNGRIGKLQRIRVTLPESSGAPADQQKPQPVPDGLDYNMWLGPAPEVPYVPGRCHYHFRWVRDYSGGALTDWGAHLIDTSQWANDTEHTGPVEVEGKGEFPSGGIYNTATRYHLEYTYASGTKLIVDSGGTGLRFEGTDGWVGNASWCAPVESSSHKILDSVIRPEETHLYTCRDGEHRNFLDCVKSRRDPYFPAEIGHRCSTVMHIGNIAMLLGRKLRWNPDKEEFLNDPAANQMRSRAMRAPWTL